MIHFYQTLDNSVREVREPSPGCWISVTDPTAQEVQSLIENYGLDSGFVRSSLDEEESSRIEREDDQTLIIVDTAVSEIQTEDTILFFTVPLGIIITDAMGMGAISQHYDPAQSAVMCLKAGADIILMPENLPLAFEAVLKAVEDGTLSEERIDESVSRVLALKQSLGR